MAYTTTPEDNETIANLPGDIRAVTAVLTDHTGATSAAHAASAISVEATGNIASTNVQAAIAELDAEKLALAGGTVSGSTTFSGAATFKGTVALAGNVTADNTITMSGAALNEAQGASVASATATDIGSAAGNFVQVTGSGTITSLGTAQAGARRIVRFTGAPTLTYNANSLILPGSANITVAAGDVAEFVSLGNGNWVCTRYQPVLGNISVPTSSAQGDILIRDSSGWTRLAAGTSGQYLKTKGSGSNPTWSDITTFTLNNTATVTGSTQGAITESFTTCGTSVELVSTTTATGVSAGTYSLQTLLQQLVNKSHTHGTATISFNCAY